MSSTFNIADLFEMVVDQNLDNEQPALICGDYRATYSQLEERSNQVAHFLKAKGIKAGDHVGLYMYNCGEYLEAMLGCFKIRAVPINVNYRYTGDELSYIFENSDMAACIHGQEFIPAIEQVKDKTPKLKLFVSLDDASGEDLARIGAENYKEALEGGYSTERDFSDRSDDDLFILYTGGTTGMPKGVMWPHKNVFMAAMGGGGHFSGTGPCEKPEDIKERSRCGLSGIALAPLMHGASWWFACIMLLAGNKLVLNPNRSLKGEDVWDIVEKEKLQLVQIVGDAMAIPLLDALNENPDRWDLSSVFNIGSGGAVFSESKQNEFKEKFPNCFITNAFGSSESGQMGSDSGNKNADNAGLGNVVKSPFMDVIIDNEGEPRRHAKPGETGIFSRSGYIPRGYYNDPEKTAKTFVEVDGKTWLLTGDAAKLEDDGLSMTIYGRGSNCINSGGEKIFPEEVEQALKAHPDIYDTLVVATPSERWGSQVTAVVSVRKGKKITLEDVQEEARKHIAGYKVPRQLHIAEEIARLPNGKPDYKWAKQYALDGKGLVG